MAKSDNLTDLLTDVADAIREKKGTTELINPQDFASEIASIETGGGNGWTGHADAEGLKAIGWTDEDIAYYQENGVDWDEEDDHLHLVSDDNKALYGVLTAYNISTYKDRIVYLPKIDLSKRSSVINLFKGCYYLVAIPALDWTNVESIASAFENCISLTSVSPIVAPGLYQMTKAFYQCYSLKRVKLNTEATVVVNQAFYKCASLLSVASDSQVKCTEMSNTFNLCGSLKSCDALDTSRVTSMPSSFNSCNSLKKVRLDVSSVTSMSLTFVSCMTLADVEISNLSIPLSLSYSSILSKDSLLYTINNEAATSPITITIATTVYNKYATDPDVVEALANHPNITLAK